MKRLAMPLSEVCCGKNLGGVENSLNGGLYHFKEKFNPTIEEYLGEFTMPIHPLYPLLRLALDFRKTLRKKT